MRVSARSRRRPAWRRPAWLVLGIVSTSASVGCCRAPCDAPAPPIAIDPIRAVPSSAPSPTAPRATDPIVIDLAVMARNEDDPGFLNVSWPGGALAGYHLSERWRAESLDAMKRSFIQLHESAPAARVTVSYVDYRLGRGLPRGRRRGRGAAPRRRIRRRPRDGEGGRGCGVVEVTSERTTAIRRAPRCPCRPPSD